MDHQPATAVSARLRRRRLTYGNARFAESFGRSRQFLIDGAHRHHCLLLRSHHLGCRLNKLLNWLVKKPVFFDNPPKLLVNFADRGGPTCAELIAFRG